VRNRFDPHVDQAARPFGRRRICRLSRQRTAGAASGYGAGLDEDWFFSAHDIEHCE
jgi:hypothetical protein